MKRLTLAVKVAETVMPKSSLDYVPNALLNITISRMIAAEGKANTAILLSKLSEMIIEEWIPKIEARLGYREPKREFFIKARFLFSARSWRQISAT